MWAVTCAEKVVFELHSMNCVDWHTFGPSTMSRNPPTIFGVVFISYLIKPVTRRRGKCRKMSKKSKGTLGKMSVFFLNCNWCSSSNNCVFNILLLSSIKYSSTSYVPILFVGRVINAVPLFLRTQIRTKRSQKNKCKDFLGRLLVRKKNRKIMLGIRSK